MGAVASFGPTPDVKAYYHLQKVRLGEGAFGTVWRGVSRETGEIVAVKQIDHLRAAKHGLTYDRLYREASMMQAVSHSNVARCFGVFEDRSSFYIAMEYLDGGDLGDKLRECRGPLAEQDAATYSFQIVVALIALHEKRICHRDVKHDNFCVVGDKLKLTDFGLATYVAPDEVLTEKCGTPAFMAPEQFGLNVQYGLAVDMWAAGLVSYMLLVGEHPFIVKQHIDMAKLREGKLNFKGSADFFDAIGLDLAFVATPSAQSCSAEAKNFCRALVNPDSSARLDARSASSSAWLQAYRDSKPRLADEDVAHRAAAEAANSSADPLSVGTARLIAAAAAAAAAAASVAGFGDAAAAASAASQLQKENDALRLALKQSMEKLAEADLCEGRKCLQAPLSAAKAAKSSDDGNSLTCAPPHASVLGPLPAGTYCRCAFEIGMYESTSVDSLDRFAFIDCVIQGFDTITGKYDLGSGMYVSANALAPSQSAPPCSESSWQRGTQVFYLSESLGAWLPATLIDYNPCAGNSLRAVDLDVRKCADIDRIRLRHSAAWEAPHLELLPRRTSGQ